ncbi:MAG: HAMP domain-containing protein, partial [Betaproteobacteria bacterium]
MTIAKRLAILIFIAVAGLVVVGAFGLRQMGAINANLEFANENSIPSIRMVANMESSFFRLRTFMLTYIMSPDAERPALAQQVMNNRERLQGYVKGYEPLVSDDKDKEYLENSKRMLAEYFSLIDRQMASIRAGQVDKAKEDAVLAGALGRRIADNVEAHIKYNEELATQEVRKAAEAYSSGKVVSMIVMVLATLGVAGLGFLVYRHVEQSLGNMVTMFKRIEHDLDFTGRLEVRGSDEVAQASTAFNRLLDRLQA